MNVMPLEATPTLYVLISVTPLWTMYELVRWERLWRHLMQGPELCMVIDPWKMLKFR